MPKAVVTKLNKEIARIFELAESKERLSALGFEPAYAAPQQFMTIIEADRNKWAELIRQNKIALE